MKILLHICCGICASSVAERLMIEGHQVTGYFYNPNIHPADEYAKRLKIALRAAEELNFELVEEKYDRENWFELVKGMGSEPEGGKRCEKCFEMRLKKTHEYFLKKGVYDAFTTTLTVGPMKNASVINSIGRALAGDRFIEADFKKKNGFIRAMELSREWGLEHQDYCGCIYSMEDALKRKEQKNNAK